MSDDRGDKVWAVGRPTIGTAVKVAGRMKVYGKERVPMTGGLVIACNHFSWVDPPALGASCPRTIYFMAKVEAHNVPGLGAFIRAFGTFPVRRGESDRDAVRTMRVDRAGRPRARPLRRGHPPATGIPGRCSPEPRWSRSRRSTGDPGGDPRLADRGSRNPADLARLG